MISLKSGFREAPPTRKPSISGFATSSLQFAGETEPVGNTKVQLGIVEIVDREEMSIF